MKLLPDNHIRDLAMNEIQKEVSFWMEETGEYHFGIKGKISDKIYEKAKDIKEALDMHLGNNTEDLKKKFGYLLFTLCNAANERGIHLSEAFETVINEIDDRLGDNEFDDKPHHNGDEGLIGFTIKLEK